MFNILLFTSIHITYTLHRGFDDFSELLQKFLQREEGRRMLRSWCRTRSCGQRGGCGRHGRNGRPSRGPIAIPIERSFLHETKFGDCNVPCNVNLLMIVPVFVCVLGKSSSFVSLILLIKFFTQKRTYSRFSWSLWIGRIKLAHVHLGLYSRKRVVDKLR